MTTVRATVDLTVRRTVVFDIDATNAAPSRIGQIIQESPICYGDDVVFHSVSWKEVPDIRCGAGEGDVFCDKQSGHPSPTHHDSATGVSWTETAGALA